jgi:FkbM family methyltransferase
MVSYADNREDVLLQRAFPKEHRGFYVDVGANDPVQGSITCHFYESGWQGINVEPVAGCFERLVGVRARDTNLKVGVADREGTLPFYDAGPASGLSTFSAEEAAARRRAGIALAERPVQVTTLATLCAEHVGSRAIDFLSVDVEGLEEAVLRGADWSRWRPRIVVVEATRPNTTVPSHGAWEPILLDAGYRFASSMGSIVTTCGTRTGTCCPG